MIIHSLAPSTILRREIDYTSPSKILVQQKSKYAKVDDTIQELPKGFFSGNHLLVEVSLPKTLRIIGPKAFLNCTQLSKIKIPITVKVIRERAFLGCKSLRVLNLPAGLTCIQEETFSRCSKLKSIIVPVSVVVIEHGAFSYCTSLLSVELPKCLKVIESRAFAHCKHLKNIEIPSTVNKLGDCSFVECERSLEFRVGSLRSRFDKLPLHKLCYYQSHYSLSARKKRLNKAIRMNETVGRKFQSRGPLSLFPKNITLPRHNFNLGLLLRLGDGYFVDSFEMTPLHILALSARPCLSICKALLAHYPSDVTSQDRYGNTPIDYACMMNVPIPIMEALLRTQRQQLNSFQDEEQLRFQYYISLTNQYDSMELLLYFTQRYFEARMKQLGLDLWQEDVLSEIEKLSYLPNDILRAEQLTSLDFVVAGYERRENISVLDLALWKGRMNSESSPVRWQRSSWRKTCQIKCGADVVIPLLLPYLEGGENFKL